MDSDKIIPQDFDVFVSYSSKDKVIADAVVAAHEKAGIRCWYASRDIAPGADWADSITKAIHQCSLMVLVFSKNANRSQRVIDEVNYAISQEKPLLPFRIESSNPSGALSLHLSSRHWLDAYDPGWEAHIERLVKSVRINLEHGSETVQISGGEADSPLEGTTGTGITKRNFLKTLGYLTGGLIVISLLGVFGWNYFGKGQPGLVPGISTITPVEYTPTDPLPVPTEAEEPSEVVSTEASSYTAVLHGSIIEGEFLLDPQFYANISSYWLKPNLFLTLTNYDYEQAAVIPGVAESWTVSPDGRIYTFYLRPDIPWVTHTLGGDTVQVTDEDGSPRYVTAEDFEYAYKRLCDPNSGENYSLQPTDIQGCQEVLAYEDPENIPQELFDEIGVKAISETELIIELENPSGFFLTTTSAFSSSAVPKWAIEKFGEAWTNPGLIPTNGTFVIDQWVPGEGIRLVRNELFPSDLSGEGNIKTVELVMVEDDNEAYELWRTNQVDYAPIPEEVLANHLDQYPAQTAQVLLQAVYYAVFNLEKQPFDNIHLRRAFSAAFNRDNYVNEIVQDGGIPMIHLGPPGVFGAPPVDEIGVGYDLEFARAELELAGYPRCQGLPKIYFATFSQRIDKHADDMIRSWEEGLECPEGTINYQGRILDFGDLGEWDIFVTGWQSDYPDEDNWVGNILFCDRNSLVINERSCNEIDELIVQARQENNASERIELYRQIEEYFFGKDGTFPIAPIFAPFNHIAFSDWLENDYWSYEEYSKILIDMDAKQVERGE